MFNKNHKSNKLFFFLKDKDWIKIIIIAEVLILLLFIPLYKSYIAVSYILNKNFIEKNLCINKNNIELNCHGKCYLSIKLKYTDNSKSETSLYFLLSIQQKEYIHHSLAEFKFFEQKIMHNFLPYYSYSFDLSSSIFHPPCIS